MKNQRDLIDAERAEHRARGALWCTHCGVWQQSAEGLTACPNCGSTGRACGPDDQLVISINLHELKLLCMWAARHGATFDNTVVQSIVDRLHAQIDEVTDACPLTLADEIGEIRKAFPGCTLRTNIPGIEP